MKPIEFKEQNCVFAKFKTHDGSVTACWRLSMRERMKILFTGRLWFQVLTFNRPLQPQYATVNKCEVIPGGPTK